MYAYLANMQFAWMVYRGNTEKHEKLLGRNEPGRGKMTSAKAVRLRGTSTEFAATSPLSTFLMLKGHNKTTRPPLDIR